MAIRRPKTNKNPPVLSHEFIIQNHADIVSCTAMVFVILLMFQTTNPLASMFVIVQHNVTGNDTTPPEEPTLYSYGMKDMCTVFFYMIICIVVHAVVQEYGLDKINRKLHLSKVKTSKFNESGQLFVFYFLSTAWGFDIILKGNYFTGVSTLWIGYPHATFELSVKFFYIMQLAYWLHALPELYFTKAKKDEIMARLEYIGLYLCFITGIYILNLTRLGLVLLVFHYFIEMLFHISRMFYFCERNDVSSIGFKAWKILFVIVRLGTIVLAFLTFWHGLEKLDTGHLLLGFATGNFNNAMMRIVCLAATCILQAYMMWNFINFQLRRMRQEKENAPSSTKIRTVAKSRNKKKGESGDDEPSENGSLRQLTPKQKKKQ